MQQAGLIATLRTDDARNRAMMAEQQLRQQGGLYQRKYQNTVKNNKCAAERMPDAVLDLLRGADTNAASANRPIAP